MWLICFCLAFEALLGSSGKAREDAPKGPLVRLSSGALEGEMHGGIAVFKGIPFARPPVGPLRWREPQPVTGWSGTRARRSHPTLAAGNHTFDSVKVAMRFLSSIFLLFTAIFHQTA